MVLPVLQPFTKVKSLDGIIKTCSKTVRVQAFYFSSFLNTQQRIHHFATSELHHFMSSYPQWLEHEANMETLGDQRPIPTPNDEAARNMEFQEATDAIWYLGVFIDTTRSYGHHSSGVLVVRHPGYIIAALLRRPLTLRGEDERDEALERDPWRHVTVRSEEEIPELTVQTGHTVMLEIIKDKFELFILYFITRIMWWVV